MFTLREDMLLFAKRMRKYELEPVLGAGLMRHAKRNGQRRGFTLMEVLLVLVILVVLASMAVLAYGPIQRKMKVDAARGQVGLFEPALGMYELAIGNLPTTSQGLDALRSAPSDLADSSKWDGPYLTKAIPPDPWNRPYQYACPGSHNTEGYDVWSNGPDGISGTADDIGNWK
jgi:general secretion pathway protein G